MGNIREPKEDIAPWWTKHKYGYVLSECCEEPISCPRCGDGWTCEWRCTKCHGRVLKSGKKASEAILGSLPAPLKASIQPPKSWNKVPSHGLVRIEAKKQDGFQPESPEFPEEIPF